VTQPSQAFPFARAWNIAFRTGHIVLTGVLVGGHVFGIGTEKLLPWFYLAMLTGAVLLILEAYPSRRWCCEGRGVMILLKLLLLCLVPWLWSYRVPILFVVIVIASVGSHMPRQVRHYSLIPGRHKANKSNP
jgi:hypothetical protein